MLNNELCLEESLINEVFTFIFYKAYPMLFKWSLLAVICMSLSGNPKETHTGIRRTFKLHTERPLLNLVPACCEVTLQTTIILCFPRGLIHTCAYHSEALESKEIQETNFTFSYLNQVSIKYIFLSVLVCSLDYVFK